MMDSMERLRRYEVVNKAKSYNELADIIESFADENGNIQGRNRSFKAEQMANNCRIFRNLPENCLTREFGIRQQAIMLKQYDDR